MILLFIASSYIYDILLSVWEEQCKEGLIGCIHAAEEPEEHQLCTRWWWVLCNACLDRDVCINLLLFLFLSRISSLAQCQPRWLLQNVQCRDNGYDAMVSLLLPLPCLLQLPCTWLHNYLLWKMALSHIMTRSFHLVLDMHHLNMVSHSANPSFKSLRSRYLTTFQEPIHVPHPTVLYWSRMVVSG